MSEPLVQDVDGNIIGCKHCGSRDIRKFGFLYRAKVKNNNGCVIIVEKELCHQQ